MTVAFAPFHWPQVTASALQNLIDADTLRFSFILYFNNVIPSDLQALFPKTIAGTYNRCVSKPGGLDIQLNTIRDLGLPAPLDFDVDFTGEIEQVQPTIVRWDASVVVDKDYQINGSVLHVDSLQASWRGVIMPWGPIDGQDCGGGPLVFNTQIASFGGVNEANGANLENTMVLGVRLQGASYIMHLNNLTAWATAG